MLEAIFYFLVFLFGLNIGSFLNCVIYRLEENKSFLKGRSFCPYCKHKLTWQDLIPLFSFFLLKGRCRYCRKKISWQYPLVELMTALLFLSIINYQLSIINYPKYNIPYIIYQLIVSCFLIIIFVYDLKHYLIPDKIIYPAILVSGIWYLVSSVFFNLYTKSEILNTIYTAFFASSFFLLIYLISQGKWLGFGDIKLAFFMGFFLGFPKILIALFLSFLIGAIIGLILIVRGTKTLKSKVPFAPFLVIGTFLAMFFGERFISWYLNFLSI